MSCLFLMTEKKATMESQGEGRVVCTEVRGVGKGQIMFSL